MLLELHALCTMARLEPGAKFFVQMGDVSLPAWWPAGIPVVAKVRAIGGPGMLLPLQFAPHWQFLWQSTDTSGGRAQWPDSRNTRSVPWERKANDIYWRVARPAFAPASRQRPLRPRTAGVGTTSGSPRSIGSSTPVARAWLQDESTTVRDTKDSKGWVTALENLPSKRLHRHG